MRDQPGYGDTDTQIVIGRTFSAWYSFVLCDARMVLGLSLPASGLHFFDQEILDSLDNPHVPLRSGFSSGYEHNDGLVGFLPISSLEGRIRWSH